MGLTLARSSSSTTAGDLRRTVGVCGIAKGDASDGTMTGSAVADTAPARPMRLPARLRRFVDQSPDFLKPDLTFEPRTADRETARYVRSFLIMRSGVGGLGAWLP